MASHKICYVCCHDTTVITMLIFALSLLTIATLAQQLPDDNYSLENIDYDQMELAQPLFLTRNSEREAEEFGANQDGKQPLDSSENDTYHESVRQSILAEMKSKFLKLTGMDQSSNNTRNRHRHRFPKHLLDGGEVHSPVEATDDHIRISTIFSFAVNSPPGRARIHNDPRNTTVYFNIPDEVNSGNLNEARLMVYIKTPEGAAGVQIEIDVGSRKIPFEMGHRGKWLHVDITDLYHLWLENTSYPALRIFGEYEGENVIEYGQTMPAHSLEDNSAASRDPIIKLKLGTNLSSRSKRSFGLLPLICQPEDEEVRCCRYPLTITFAELGLDFVIYPQSFQSNYCEGMCADYALPGHGDDARTVRRSRCCTPTSKSPLLITYYDRNGSVVRAQINNMVIDSCGCQ